MSQILGLQVLETRNNLVWTLRAHRPMENSFCHSTLSQGYDFGHLLFSIIFTKTPWSSSFFCILCQASMAPMSQETNAIFYKQTPQFDSSCLVCTVLPWNKTIYKKGSFLMSYCGTWTSSFTSLASHPSQLEKMTSLLSLK